MKISPDVIRVAKEARNELSPFLNQLDFRIFSKYNVGYLRYQKDPVTYFIDLEINRFLYTANYIYRHFTGTIKILDVGVFVPVLPIMLSKLGYQVEAIEKLSLYENTLNPILEFINKKYAIGIYNLDIINGDLAILDKQFDVVMLLAILEHLNGSPKRLLEKCRRFLKSSGYLFVDGPNLASMPKRISFLIKGKSPLPDYSDYFWSEYPFEGHNREYTMTELHYALISTGFELCKSNYLDLTLPPDARLMTRVIKILSKMGPKNWRDVIWTVSKPKSKSDLPNSE